MNRTAVMGVAFLVWAGAACSSSQPAMPGVGGSSGGSVGGGSGATGGSSAGSGGAAGGAGVGSSGAGGGAGASPLGAGGSGGGSSGVAGSGGAAGTSTAPRLVISGPDGYWRTTETWTEVASGDADVLVAEAATAQTWEGFGAIFHEKGWSNLSALSPADRDRAMRLLFDRDGCRFAFGRIPIGASDFALERYTANETAGDYAMEHFSIERDKQTLIPYIKAALALKPDIRLWASPWTPPTWMKTASAGRDLSFDRGSMKADVQTLQAYALYLTRFVQEYGKAGLKIESVAPQTDPTFEDDIPSCRWSAQAFATFVGTHLGPTFASQNVSAAIDLSAIGIDTTAPAFIRTVAADTTTTPYFSSLGLVYDVKPKVLELKAVGLPIRHTQHDPGNPPYLSTSNHNMAPNDHAYAVTSWNLIAGWIRDGVVSYTAANLVLDRAGWQSRSAMRWAQNALLVVDGGALTVTPAYYVFRHVSQFVDPGATVMGVVKGDALAFRNPDGTRVVIVHAGNAAKTAIVEVGGKKLQVALPATGWATINLKSGE